jgi:predicted SAM-dependent methyltransferase
MLYKKRKHFNFYFLLTNLGLILKAFFLLILSYRSLIGRDFDYFAKYQSVNFFKKNQYSYFIFWFCNPVSIVRYFEFPFCHQAINWEKVTNYLDVSSPRLFFLFLLDRYPHLSVNVINPDKSDLNETREIIEMLGFKKRVVLENQNALQLDYPDQHFDVVTSISVLEHIPSDGDQEAIKELWRVLKPGGKLIITVPCMKIYQEEYREKDVYGLGNPQKANQYFFQRLYDYESLKIRFMESISSEPKTIQVFGEKEYGIFFEYEKRWIQNGLKETVKDPLHIVHDYKFFPSIDDLPGMGVCGLVFEKEDLHNV